jgi:nucleotide-binding universal stress UspA family protein
VGTLESWRAGFSAITGRIRETRGETAVYGRILVAIEHSAADSTILGHIRQLARLTGARLLLLHVADGWAARAYDELTLRESEEMRADRSYLEQLTSDLTAAGFDTEWRLAKGDPATEIIRVAGEEEVDLVAMSTHGHRFLGDLLHGTTVDRVRHSVAVPVLLLRAPKEEKPKEET